MTVFNRVLVTAILLLIVVLAVGAIGVATGFLTVGVVDRVYAYAPLHQALSDFHASHSDETRVRKVLVATGTAILAFLLLLSEVTPPRRQRTFRLMRHQQGDVTIGYGTVRKVAEVAGRSVAGVQHARCAIHRTGDSFHVSCRVTIDRYANGEVVGRQVETAIQRQLEQTLGKPVERVRIRVEAQLHQAPLTLR